MTTGGSLDHTGLKRTGLFQSHVDIGAKLVPFAGWEMPLQYKGILAEARAVRSGVGIFDVSPTWDACSSPAAKLRLFWTSCSRPMPALASGRCRYCMICNEAGGIVDDVVVARLAPERFLLVCNAANREKVVEAAGYPDEGRPQ